MENRDSQWGCLGKEGNFYNLRTLSSNYVFMCMPVCGYVHIHADSCGGQKRASEPLELELQVVVSLSTKFWSSGRAASGPICHLSAPQFQDVLGQVEGLPAEISCGRIQKALRKEIEGKTYFQV